MSRLSIRKAAAALSLALLPPLAAQAAASPAHRFGHIFVVVLENKGYDNSFGANTPAPYLARTLPSRGALLQQYYGIGHNSLDNYIAMISGQGPNPETQADCGIFSDFRMQGTLDGDGQAVGSGCVYPASVLNLADQLEAAKLNWRGYMEDMGKDPAREAAACGHPAVGEKDMTLRATVKDQYATKHDPFAYFHSIIDDKARCESHVVPLDRLRSDLKSVASTPAFAFITPNLCHDGHDHPCVDGEPGGLLSADKFLHRWIPVIQASPAYRRDGLIVVTFDESDGPQADSSACCGEGAAPNAAQPGLTGPGGGRIGAVLLSPRIHPKTVSTVPYNHYSLLKTIEENFGLTALGYAQSSHVTAFGDDILALTPPPQAVDKAAMPSTSAASD